MTNDNADFILLKTEAFGDVVVPKGRIYEINNTKKIIGGCSVNLTAPNGIIGVDTKGQTLADLINALCDVPPMKLM